MKVLFIGDISLNDGYVSSYEHRESPFKDVKSLLQDCDIVVGNLESMSSGNDGVNTRKHPRLATSVSTLNYLLDLNMGLACIANNHVYDNLESGFERTVSFFNANSIDYIGASLDDELLPYIIKNENVSVAIMNYVTRDTNPCVPDDALIKINYFDLEEVTNQIHHIKEKVDFVILCLHWGGNMEGSMFPDRRLPDLAHKLIDIGADLIIGHHSHTLQPCEKYKGKYIFYSLGNFCFSDIKTEVGSIELDKKRTSKSMIVSTEFSTNGISIDLFPIKQVGLNILRDNKSLTQFRIVKPFLYIIIQMQPIWWFYYLYEKQIYPVVSFLFANGRNPLKQISKLRASVFKERIIRITSHVLDRSYKQ